MAKWTKRNNPHTWSGKSMAKRTHTYAPSRAIVVRAPSAPNVIRVSAPRQTKKKHHHRKGSGGGALTLNKLGGFAIGGALFGFIQKQFPNLPTLPIVGQAGSITAAAYMLAKGKGSGLARDVAIAGAVLSGYQIGFTGKISGEDISGELARQVSGGIAAQV